MAKLIKLVELSSLSDDISSVSKRAIEFVVPFVRYDSDILDDSFNSFDNPTIAIELSGTRDKKSKDYKAAIRSVQKWKKGESTPSKRYQRKLIDMLARTEKLSDSSLMTGVDNSPGNITVSITGYVQISQTPAEYRTLHTTFNRVMLHDFLEEAVNGNNEGALGVFADTGNYPFFELYSSAENPLKISFS